MKAALIHCLHEGEQFSNSVRMLLHFKSDPNYVCKDGRTTLTAACENTAFELIALELISNKAELNKPNQVLWPTYFYILSFQALSFHGIQCRTEYTFFYFDHISIR